MRTSPASARSSLVWFTLLSLGLHAVVLFGMKQPLRVQPPTHLGQLVVVLEDQRPVQNARASLKAKPVRPIPETATDTIALTEQASASITPEPDEQTTNDASAVMIRNQLLGTLQTRLSRYLSYPPLARQRGWEGTVLLGLRVESDGQLENLRIERSSGYALLDDSALNSLSRVGRLTEAPGWLNGRGLDMQLPVIYRLIEN